MLEPGPEPRFKQVFNNYSLPRIMNTTAPRMKMSMIKFPLVVVNMVGLYRISELPTIFAPFLGVVWKSRRVGG